jgi:hypothetical protein
MLELLRSGGVPGLFVVLFGLLTLAAATRFAIRPHTGDVAGIRALTATTAFAVLTALAANFTAVMWKVTGRPEWAHDPELHLIVMRGLGEATTPAILGFAVLTVTWFLVALGRRRAAQASALD